jgi:hypothetical protein
VTLYENAETQPEAELCDQILHELNENTTETYENLKWAYGEHAVLRAQVFRRHKAFRMAVRL